MRVGLVGRTGMLLSTARRLRERGHAISFVHTCPAEEHYGTDAAAFRDFAAAVNAPFLETPRVAEAMSVWRASGTDVAVSVNWPTLIGQEALELFPFGVLNAHAGDLPRYRGNACPNWAILNHEPRIGLTIHRMVPELDGGPYLVKAFLPIDETTYIGDVYRWLDEAVPEAFVEALDRLPSPGFVPQDASIRPLRCFPRRPSDGRIDWRAPTRDVLALIRATSRPFQGAFTTFEGHDVVHIFAARRHDAATDHLAMPGQVCLRHDGHPVIATDDGLVELLDLSSVWGGSAETSAKITASLRSRLV